MLPILSSTEKSSHGTIPWNVGRDTGGFAAVHSAFRHDRGTATAGIRRCARPDNSPVLAIDEARHLRKDARSAVQCTGQWTRTWRTVSGTTFDTLSAAEALEAAGIEEAHAKAIAVAIRSGQGDLATKADINELRTEVASVRSELASVRSELATIRWVVGIQSAVMLATFAIVAAKLL